MTREQKIERFKEGKKIKDKIISSDKDYLYFEGYFTLAYSLKRKQYEKCNVNELWLINGDIDSTISQRYTISCIVVLRPNIQIPFSALRQAKINIEEIEVLDFQSDTWKTVRYIDEMGVEHEDEEHILGAVVFRAKQEGKWKYYLSSIDKAVWWRRSYFLSWLRYPCFSVEKAFEQLKPRKVLDAEKKGVAILRQGEWFFLKVAESLPAVKKIVSKNARKEFEEFTKKEKQKLHELKCEDYVVWKQKQRNRLKLGGDTGHHIVKRKIGPYVSGTVRHSNREHPTLILGKSWWLPMKNTARFSWSAAGKVD